MHRALLPPGWPRPKGYANGVAATLPRSGRQIFVAGMIGWDAEGRFADLGIAGQTRRALMNVVEVLAEGGATPAHITRMTWYVTDKQAYLAAGREIGAAYRELIGNYDVAMTAVEVSALMEDKAVVEIEVTAIVPD
jgi:enamine deaminase RidA (YjgF/YER057c/UK114 family)